MKIPRKQPYEPMTETYSEGLTVSHIWRIWIISNVDQGTEIKSGIEQTVNIFDQLYWTLLYNKPLHSNIKNRLLKCYLRMMHPALWPTLEILVIGSLKKINAFGLLVYHRMVRKPRTIHIKTNKWCVECVENEKYYWPMTYVKFCLNCV